VTKTQRMRRHARRARRAGLQPMVVINSDDQLPDLLIAVICRVLWRYRSELAPAYVALGLALSGVLLHVTHPGWWAPILIATAVTAWLVAIFGTRIGLTLRDERYYAAAVVTAAGSWLSAVTALGMTARPLPHVLLVGGLVFAVPWWAHRRRRAKVRVERKLSAWPEIAQVIGLAGSRVQSAIVDVWGWRARFALARGQTLDDAIAKTPAIESALGTHRGAIRIYPTLDEMANRFELRVLDTDPHADAIEWPGASVGSITEPIDLGPFEDATSARVLILRRHVLIGGIAGSGKSGGINVLMGNLTACPDVVIWAIDLKRGMELRPWASCIDRLATTPEQAHALLRDAVAVLEARADWLTGQGRRIWEPTPQSPALVIIIDEYAELSDAPEATTDTDSIARRGRAVAVTLIAATQRPTQNAMGKGAVRSQMDVRISFRVRERKDVDLILGQGMLTAGWHAHALNAPGKFLVSAQEHDTPRRGRAYLVTDETVTETAERHTDRRPQLDEISHTAIEEGRAGIHVRTTEPIPDAPEEPEDDPEAVLWEMLAAAPAEGIPVPHLVQATGMSRPWIYQRLRHLSIERRVVQVSRGRWRAATDIRDNHPE
jgi:FtsK/SpoIIIE family